MIIKKKESIMRNGCSLLLAYDHGMEHGTADFNDQSIDPEKILQIADSGYFTGIVLQKGIAEKYYQPGEYKVPLIVKLNGKTNFLKNEEPYSAQLCRVQEAIQLGAVAVGYTIYVGSQYEERMMKEFSKIEQEADEAGIAAIGWMYPRGKAVAGKEESKEVLSYAARLGLEMGAEMVKLPYSGDKESFSWVVKAAGRTKVLVQGGQKTSERLFFQMIKNALAVGAVGAAVGRNVWQAGKPLAVAEKLYKIIFNDV